MTPEGLEEMFEGDFAETFSEQISSHLDGRLATPSSVRSRGRRHHTCADILQELRSNAMQYDDSMEWNIG